MILLIGLCHLVSFDFDKLFDFIAYSFLSDLFHLFLIVRFNELVLSFAGNAYAHGFIGLELLSDMGKSRRLSFLGCLYCVEGALFQLCLVLCWVIRNISFICQAFAYTLACGRCLDVHMLCLFQFMLFLLVSLDLIKLKVIYDQEIGYQRCRLVAVCFLI